MRSHHKKKFKERVEVTIMSMVCSLNYSCKFQEAITDDPTHPFCLCCLPMTIYHQAAQTIFANGDTTSIPISKDGVQPIGSKM